MKSKEKGQASMLLTLLIVMAIMLTLAGISVPVLKGVQRGKNESQTIGNMQTVLQALNTYYNLYGQYPPSATDLTGCASGAPTSTNACLLSPSLIGTLNGYNFGYGTEVDSTHNPVSLDYVGYKISEVPVSGDQGAITYCATSSAANADSYPTDGLIHGTLSSLYGGTAANCIGYPVYSNNGQGPSGPPGPVHGYYAAFAGSSLTNGTNVTASLTLPQGYYLLTSQFNYYVNGSGGEPNLAQCTAYTNGTQADIGYSGQAGNSTALGSVTITGYPAASRSTLPLTWSVSLGTTGTITVTCLNANSTGPGIVYNGGVSAIPLTNFN